MTCSSLEAPVPGGFGSHRFSFARWLVAANEKLLGDEEKNDEDERLK